MTQQTPDPCRAAFENWCAQDERWRSQTLAKDDQGEYKLMHTFSVWQTWQPAWAAALASAPVEALSVGDGAGSVHETNAMLASRYFDLLKVVEGYEKSGVTCQTFRHFVDAPCAECNRTSGSGQVNSEQLAPTVAPSIQLSEEEKELLNEVLWRAVKDGHCTMLSVQGLERRIRACWGSLNLSVLRYEHTDHFWHDVHHILGNPEHTAQPMHCLRELVI